SDHREHRGRRPLRDGGAGLNGAPLGSPNTLPRRRGMTERLSMRAIREILRLRWVQGQPHRAVALSTGRSVGAVHETLRCAHEAGLDWAGVDGMTDDALEAALYRRPAAAGPRGTRPQPD